MQIANETIVITIASLIISGTSTNDGLSGVRKLINKKINLSQEFNLKFTHDQLY